jgi:hypothetical protein
VADVAESNTSVTPDFWGFSSERGPKAPFDTICLNLNRPLVYHKGDVWEKSDSTETQPSKPVCDSDNRATKVVSQVKNWFVRIGFQGPDPQELRGRNRFGNHVDKFVDRAAVDPALVCKMEKSGQLFALEMQRDEASLSS